MNIFCHIPRENWICDRMGFEYSNLSSHKISFEKISNQTNIIWLLGSWCWNQIPKTILKSNLVVCTIHHEVPWKFNDERKNNFLERDQYVDHYLTYTEKTKNLIEKFSEKPVDIIPHWVNTDIWNKLEKIECKNKLNLPLDRLIVGSFQRDTEGSDLKTPKLEKGPDIFLKKIVDISNFKKVHVLLGGWRRQFIISELEKVKIPYTYFELPDLKKINIMYNSLDLYLVSSRCEGGPQSIFEATYLNVPILSTPVGQSKLILDEKCIYQPDQKLTPEILKNSNLFIDKNYKNVLKFNIKDHVKVYDSFFERLVRRHKKL